MVAHALVPSPLPLASSSSPRTRASSVAPKVSHASHSSSLGVHDALRSGPRSLSAELAPKHPLEARLANWGKTQESLKLTMHRQMYGLGMPLREMMERDLVQQGSILPLPGQMRPSNVHLDILLGRDETMDVSDTFLPDRDVPMGVEAEDFHSKMERRLRL